MSTATTYQPGTFTDVNPKDLAIGTNARQTVDQKSDAFTALVASIKARGVLEPVTAYTADDGQLTVHRGQRRTLAAIKAKCARVPVIVIEQPQDSDRVIDQLAENVHRDAMTSGDVAAAVEQLAAFGLTEAQIVKQSAFGKGQVSAALAARKSTAARTAAEEQPELGLHHLAGIAEFDSDDDAVQELTDAAESGDFDHKLQELRDQREEKAAHDAYAAGLREQGLTLIDEPPWRAEEGPARLDSLTDDIDDHTGCPGHAVYVGLAWVWRDPAGVVVDTDTLREMSWSDRREAGIEQFREPAAQPACIDPEGNGHTRRLISTGAPEQQKGPMTDAEKAARSLLIDKNKQWRSASKVRRDWLFEFVDRKDAPKDASVFIYRELLHGGYQLQKALEHYGKHGGHQVFRDVMGLDVDGLTDGGTISTELGALLDRIADMTPKRATLLTAAMLMCAWHAYAETNTWQNPDEQARRMLRQMRDWGYGLSAVERSVVDPPEVAEPAAEGDDDATEVGPFGDEPDDDGIPDAATHGLGDEALAVTLDGEPTTITADSVIVAIVDHHDLTAEPVDETRHLTAVPDPIDDIA